MIGGGVAGSSFAFELLRRRPSLSVVILESTSTPFFHSSGRTAAVFCRDYGGSEVVLELNRRTRPQLARFLTPRGVAIVTGTGHSPEVGNRGDAPLRAVNPLLLPGVVGRVDLLGAEDINIPALLAHLNTGVNRILGFKVASAQKQQSTGAQWLLVAEDGRSVIARLAVVNAAGAWADVVAKSVFGARPLGLQPTRRSMAVLSVPAATSITPLTETEGEDAFYFKSLPPGRVLLSPCDETPCEPHDATADDRAIDIALDRFESLTGLRPPILRTWAGLRTFSKDRIPVAGWATDVKGLFWLAGQGGVGFQTSFALAQDSVDVFLGELDHPELSPARFAPPQQSKL